MSHVFRSAGSAISDGGLIFEDALPLLWLPQPLAAGSELARLNADNHQLLGAESSLDEVRLNDVLKDESPALLQELQRLEFKLNILLRLTAQVAMQNEALPPRCMVRLTPKGLEWEGAEEAPVGATGLLKLYINAALPQPLSLPCLVVAERHGAASRVAQMRFVGVSEVVADLLEKLIFRHHRRLIAVSKHATA